MVRLPLTAGSNTTFNPLISWISRKKSRRSTSLRLTEMDVDLRDFFRSEEHTSELQSHLNLVCRLLLEKKKLEVRLPRVLLAFLVGASLAAVGVELQALLRNPLADPYILGVSIDAALGAVRALQLRIAW